MEDYGYMNMRTESLICFVMEDKGSDNEPPYAVPLRKNITGVLNPVFDGEQVTTNIDVPPEIPPSPIMNSEYCMLVNNAPLYANQVPIPNKTTNHTSTECEETVIQGRQLKQSCIGEHDDVSYSSCNDVSVTAESVANACGNFALNSPSLDSNIEKGGYVQPVDVFNNLNVEETDCATNIALRKQYSTKKNNKKEQKEIQHEDGMNEYVGYLSPSDPSLSCDSESDTESLTVDFHVRGANFKENAYSSTPTKRDFQRLDSGFEECASTKGSNPPTPTAPTSFRNRLSTCVEQHYEDIDFYNNEKKSETINNDRLVSTRSTSSEITRPSRIEVPPRLTTRDVRPSCNGHAYPMFQKRVDLGRPDEDNYHQVTTLPRNTYQPVSLEKDNPHKRRECLFFVLVFMTLFLISVLSLAISISTLMLQGQDRRDTGLGTGRPELSSDAVNQSDKASIWSPGVSSLPVGSEKHPAYLQYQLQRLKKENVALKQSIRTRDEDIEKRLDGLTAKQLNLSIALESVSSEFTTQIFNKSSTIFPQRHHGMSQLSSCTMKYSSFARPASNGRDVETTFEPSINDMKTSVVLFAFCTYKGMEAVSLDARTVNSHIQYRCRCTGNADRHGNKVCTIYYWLCPWT